MPTLTLTDAEHALLIYAMRSHAHKEEHRAAQITRDAGQHMRQARAVAALARKIEKPAPGAPTKAFTRGGYSFRQARYSAGDTYHSRVYRKGEGECWRATIIPTSDGVCWIISQSGYASDARPSFAEACDLVMARLPREW